MHKHKHLIVVLVIIAIALVLLLFSPKVLDNNLTGLENSSAASIQRSTIYNIENVAAVQTRAIAWLLRIENAIGPATSEYVTDNLAAAALARARVVVLAMDTPGGLDTSMREIIRAILDSPVPVVGFVSPKGARAASAGTYILYASHIAAMSPATNLGAATPFQIGGGMGISNPEKPKGKNPAENQGTQNTAVTMKDKSINDAAAYIRSLAELRGRNIEWAELAVREASSLPAHQALEMNVIDLIADDVADLLQNINGRQLVIQGRNIVLDTTSIKIEEVNPDWRNRFLSVITNPNIAYLLMLIGVYGLFFEFYNPGVIIPGVAGAISLLIALYAFQVLPVNYAGLALIGLGIGLMILEAFVPSTGILGVGGVIAFVIGSVILMDTESEAFKIALPLIIAVALFSVLILIFMVGMVLRARRSTLVSGDSMMLGEKAEIMEDFTQQGLVRVHGELWQAVTEKPVHKGEFFPIKAIRGLTLWLQNIEDDTGDQP